MKDNPFIKKFKSLEEISEYLQESSVKMTDQFEDFFKFDEKILHDQAQLRTDNIFDFSFLKNNFQIFDNDSTTEELNLFNNMNINEAADNNLISMNNANIHDNRENEKYDEMFEFLNKENLSNDNQLDLETEFNREIKEVPSDESFTLFDMRLKHDDENINNFQLQNFDKEAEEVSIDENMDNFQLQNFDEEAGEVPFKNTYLEKIDENINNFQLQNFEKEKSADEFNFEHVNDLETVDNNFANNFKPDYENTKFEFSVNNDDKQYKQFEQLNLNDTFKQSEMENLNKFFKDETESMSDTSIISNFNIGSNTNNSNDEYANTNKVSVNSQPKIDRIKIEGTLKLIDGNKAEIHGESII